MEKHATQHSDEDLVRLFQKHGNRQALGILYKRYAHLVLGLCLDYLKNREDAKDAVMDIFEKTSRKLPDQEIKSFKPWLFFVSRNHCIDILRKQYRQIPQELSDVIFVESEDISRPIEEERIELLTEAISTLKAHQRDCINLFYLQGNTYDKVAAKTGFSEKQVKSYLQNGRRNLKNILLKLEHERAK